MLLPLLNIFTSNSVGVTRPFPARPAKNCVFFFPQSVDAPDILKKCIFYKQEDSIRRRADRHGGGGIPSQREKKILLFLVRCEGG